MTIDPVTALAVKMLAAAGLVVCTSMVAERLSPFLAGMLASLPVSVGPVYVFLAMDHDAAFVSQAALGSLAINAVNAIFCLVYALAAQRLGTVASLGLALASWFVMAAGLRLLPITLGSGLALTALVYAVVIPLTRPFARARAGVIPPRPWYALPVRAAAVALLVLTVTVASWHLGATMAGLLAIFPVVLSSLIAILQPRIGGPATAAMTSDTLQGLVGLAVALTAVHLIAPVAGSAVALSVALAICLMWNGLLIAVRRRPWFQSTESRARLRA